MGNKGGDSYTASVVTAPSVCPETGGRMKVRALTHTPTHTYLHTHTHTHTPDSDSDGDGDHDKESSLESEIVTIPWKYLPPPSISRIT